MRLRVNGVILDSNNSSIGQTYEASNFGDISTRQGGYSNDFTIPLTSKNDAALGFISDINTIDRTPYIKVNAELLDVGAVVSTGYIRCKISSYEKGDKFVEATFFSDNTEWFNLIKDKKLTDLDLSEYNHIWNESNIVDSMTAGDSLGYTYPLIEYGKFNKFTTLDSSDIAVNTSFFYPAMYVKNIIRSIYKDAGYTVEGSLFNEDRINNMIQPFSAKDFVKSSEYISTATKKYENFLVPDLDTDLQSETIQWAIIPAPFSNIMKVDYNGVYKMRYSVTCSYTRTNPVGGLIVTLRGSIANPAFTLWSKSSFGDLADQSTFTLTTDAPFDGRAYPFTDSSEIASGISINFTNGEQGVLSVTDAYYTFEPVPDYNHGEEIDMASTMPDIKQSDFLKYIFFSFGVVPQVDNISKTVRLNLFKDIKDNIPNSIDWSNKLDLSKGYNTDFTKLLNNYSRSSFIKYKEDGEDNELSAYSAEAGTGFGDGFLTIDNEHLEESKDIYESPYSPTINVNSIQNSINIPQINWFGSNDGVFSKEFKVSPKMLLITDDIPIANLTEAIYDKLIVSKDCGTQIKVEVENGSVTSAELVKASQRYPYSSIPFVLVSAPDDENGTKAVINITLETTGLIDQVIISDAGSGYTSPPEITIVMVVSEIASTENVPFSWFIKTPYTPDVDVFKYNLSYGSVLIDDNEDNNLKQDFLTDTETVLNNMKGLTAYFTLDESDIVNIDFLIPVYISKYKSYFFINKVDAYKGSEYSTKVELIKIGG